MQYLILESQIAGRGIPEEMLPKGGSLAEGPANASLDSLYFDGETVKLKPEQPSEKHAWDAIAKEWKEAILELPAGPDWDGFIDALRDSPVWTKWFAAAEETLKANVAATFLLGVLTGTQNLKDLDAALIRMDEALKAKEVKALTPTQKEQLAAWRKQFNLTLPEAK